MDLNKLLWDKQLQNLVDITRHNLLVMKNYVKILFRKDKDINIRSIEIQKEYQFDKSLFKISFDIINFLWIDINGIKCYNNEEVFMLYDNPKNLTFIIKGLKKLEQKNIELLSDSKIQESNFTYQINTTSPIVRPIYVSKTMDIPQIISARCNINRQKHAQIKTPKVQIKKLQVNIPKQKNTFNFKKLIN